MSLRRTLFAAAFGAVLLGLSTAGYAQAVLQSVTVRVEPGQMTTYLERVAALQGVLDRADAGGRVAVWNADFAGSNAGTTLVGVSFPSLAAYAESTTKTNADPEWQQIMTGLGDIRTVVSTALLVSQDGAGPVEPPAAGSILQGVIARAHPGQAAAYQAKLQELQQVQKRLETSGQMRIWRVSVGGEMAGSFAIAIIYPSLAAYAADSAKVQADPEGAKLFASFEEIRTVVSNSLFTAQ